MNEHKVHEHKVHEHKVNEHKVHEHKGTMVKMIPKKLQAERCNKYPSPSAGLSHRKIGKVTFYR